MNASLLLTTAGPQRTIAASPSTSATPSAPPASGTQDTFQWSKALALPAYAYGGGAAALSGLTSFAQRFPAGGVTINPAGIIPNPEWTRHFGPDSLFGQLQPIAAGVGAGVLLLRGALELREGLKNDCARSQIAAALDIGLAAVTATQAIAPGMGAVLAVPLIIARAVVDIHP